MLDHVDQNIEVLFQVEFQVDLGQSLGVGRDDVGLLNKLLIGHNLVVGTVHLLEQVLDCSDHEQTFLPGIHTLKRKERLQVIQRSDRVFRYFLGNRRNFIMHTPGLDQSHQPFILLFRVALLQLRLAGVGLLAPHQLLVHVLFLLNVIHLREVYRFLFLRHNLLSLLLHSDFRALLQRSRLLF